MEEREKKNAIAWGKKTERELESELHALREKLQEIEQSKEEATKKKEEWKKINKDANESGDKAHDAWTQAASYLEHAAQELENETYCYELWKEAAEMATQTALFYEESAQQHAAGNELGNGERFNLSYAAKITLNSAKVKAEQVIPWRSQQKAALEQGREEEAQLWEQAINNALEAAQLFERSVQQRAAGNELGRGGGDDLSNAATSTLKSAKAKAEQIIPWKSQQKAALEQGKVKEAQLLGEAINKALEAALLYEQSAQQYAAGNQYGEGGGFHLSKAARSTLDSAKAKAKKILSQNVGK